MSSGFGSVLPSVRSQRKISDLAFQFFSVFFFCIKLDSHKVRKVTKPGFEITSRLVTWALKVLKVA